MVGIGGGDGCGEVDAVAGGGIDTVVAFGVDVAEESAVEEMCPSAAVPVGVVLIVDMIDDCRYQSLNQSLNHSVDQSINRCKS